MTDTAPEPTRDWQTDYDLLDPRYAVDPYPIWDELRQQCPVAHTQRHGGSFMPTRYDDLRAIARDHDRFSSRDVAVIAGPDDPPPDNGIEMRVPPIDSDPPEHLRARRMILPFFSPQLVEERDEPFTRALCKRLVDGFVERFEAGEDVVDGAAEYAQQIPPRVIGHLLGIPESMTDEFVGWVRGILELGYFDDDLRIKSRDSILNYFIGLVAERLENPGDDLISQLLHGEVDGVAIEPIEVAQTCNLLLIAGIDTTWSSIGSAMWHLAGHPEDRQRLVDDPGLIPLAVEELLRAYSPVTMARIVAADTEYAGCPMSEGDRIIMNFPAANRDPEAFPDADKVIIDRAENRHIAFGVGIHRCGGSNQARLEMRVAIEEFLARIPDFELADPGAVTWAAGQVRGPRILPIRIRQTR
ncbi:MAG: cytochrome P450 [Acidimicrobiales bacterium]|nr:cytochrome P450 [Acidimicrobiales bacterium]